MDRFSETSDEIRSMLPKALPKEASGLYGQLTSMEDGKVVSIGITEIVLKRNVRANIDTSSPEFRQLVESIKDTGLLQYPVISPVGGDILCIAGHRRLLALKELGWTKVRCVVRHWDAPEEQATATLVENIARQALAPLDLARAVSLVIKNEGSVLRVAELLARDRKYIERLRNIDGWPEAAKEIIHANPERFPLRTLMYLASRRRTGSELTEVIRSHLTPVARKPSVRPRAVAQEDVDKYSIVRRLSEREKEVVVNFLREFQLLSVEEASA